MIVIQSCSTLCDPWTVARQAPLSVELSRQEYWSGLPFPSPGDVPNLGIKSGSPALQVDSLLSEPAKPSKYLVLDKCRLNGDVTVALGKSFGCTFQKDTGQAFWSMCAVVAAPDLAMTPLWEREVVSSRKRVKQ